MLGLPSPAFGWSMNEDATHLAERLSRAGYHAALFGVQHETNEGTLDRLGFDGTNAGARPGPELADDVAGFLEADDRPEPFYAQVGLFETHEPLDFGGAEPDREDGVAVPPLLADEPTTREYLAQFQGLLRQADRTVGAILDALDRAGLREETLVVFTSDHGIPFSRAKGYLYDAGTGVPLLVRWPGGGIEGGRTVDALASNVDFVPTLCDLLDLEAETDGRSFADALDGSGDAPGDDRAVYAAFHDHRRWGFGPDARSVRTDRYKLIRNFESGAHFEPPIDLSTLGRLGRDGLKSGGTRPPVELYDLDADPHEFESVAEDPDHAEARRRLDRRLYAHLRAVDDPVLEEPPASPFAERALATFEESGGE
jgi:arylsulfatase A-like enzyme